VGIQGRVHKPYRVLSDLQPRLVDERHHAPERGARCARPVDQGELSVNGNYIVGSVGTDVGESTDFAAVVVAVSPIRWWVSRQVVLHRRSLVRRQWEHVAEAAAAVDDGLARGLRLSSSGKVDDDVGAGRDLSGADGCNIRAASGEGRIEPSRSAVVVATIRVDALAPIPCDS